MVLLVTSDNEQFHAEKEVVERSVLIKNMLEGEPPLLIITAPPHANQMSVKQTSQSLCQMYRLAY